MIMIIDCCTKNYKTVARLYEEELPDRSSNSDNYETLVYRTKHKAN